MAEHPNVALVRKGYEAFAKADLATIQSLFADDVVWHIGGSNALTGDYKGKDSVLGEFLAKVITLSEGTFKTEVHDIVGNDSHVVALTHATGARAGKGLDLDGLTVFHVSGGKVTEAWSLSTDQSIEDAFWS